jgi:predicted CxxxxCH...CXXCH cytochrome family protein
MLVNDNILTPNSGLKAVTFTSLTGAGSFADGAAPYTGVCEVCHTVPGISGYHLNNAVGTHNNGSNCTTCHTHANNFAAPDCNACHIAIPAYNTDAHQVHAVTYNFDCSICHFNYGGGGSLEASHPSGTANVSFDPNGLSRRNGLDANTPTWTSGTKTCTNIYCHSNGVTADRGSDGTYTWGNLPFGTVVYATTPSWASGVINTCTPCHAGLGNMVSPYTMSSPGYNTPRPATGSHGTASHTDNDQTFSGYGWTNVQCFWCHNANGAAPNGVNFQGTYGTSFHVDGQTHFKPIWYSSGGTFANGHAYAGNGAQAHCGVGKTCW